VRASISEALYDPLLHVTSATDPMQPNRTDENGMHWDAPAYAPHCGCIGTSLIFPSPVYHDGSESPDTWHAEDK